MEDQDKSNNSKTNNVIDKLVAKAIGSKSDDFNRPSDKCIQDYLLGNASEQQKSEMWTALDASASFRKEVLEITGELKAFSSLETAQKASKIEVDKIPDFSNYIGRRNPKTSIFQSLKEFFTLPRLIPAAVVAALILFVSIQIFRSEVGKESIFQTASNLLLVAKNVDPGLLISNTVRGQTESRLFAAPDSAALAEFRFLLSFEDGVFKLQPEPKRPVIRQVSRTVQLTILDQNENLIREISAQIPVTDSTIATIEAWLLSLPSRTLYKVDMERDTMTVKVDKKEIPKGGITFTYGSGNWFSSTMGFVFQSAEAE